MYGRRLRWRRRIYRIINIFVSRKLGGKHLLNGQGGFGNHLTGVGAKDVDTEDAISLSVGEEFDLYNVSLWHYRRRYDFDDRGWDTYQTFGFQVGLGTAVGGEGEGSY